MGLSMYVWFSSLGFPHTTLEFPYKRQSPITKKNRDYCNSEEVEDEIMNLSDTFQDSKFTIGRNLYFHIPLFANPKWFIEDEYMELIKEFNYIKNYNIPMAKTLDDADSYKIANFDIIQKEITAIQQYLGETNGR